MYIYCFKYEDVTTPLVDKMHDCDCTEAGPDGYLDLTLKFDVQEVIAALGEINDGNELELTVTGFTDEGTRIRGSDCVIILKKPKLPPVLPR